VSPYPNSTAAPQNHPIFCQPDSQQSPGSAYEEFPSPQPSNPQRVPAKPFDSRPNRTSEDRSKEPGYGGSGRRYDERRRPLDEDYASIRRSEDAYTGVDYTTSRKRDTTGRSQERERQRDPPGRPPANSSDTPVTNAQTATATSGIVIPTKSTIAEENIEIPFGRESTSMAVGDRGRSADADVITDGEPESGGYSSALGGLSGLTARLRVEEEDERPISGGGNRSGEEYYDKVSLVRAASAASDRSNNGPRVGSSSTAKDDLEKLRRDYEFKMATMQNQIANLEREISDADDQAAKYRRSEERLRQLEDEIADFKLVS
jgi:protein SPA2